MNPTVFVIYTVEHGIECVCTNRLVAERAYEELKQLAAYRNINVLVDEHEVRSI